MDRRQRIYRQSKSDDPSVAFPALIRRGMARPVLPTTRTGWLRYSDGGCQFFPAATNLVTDPQGTATTFWGTGITDVTTTANTAATVLGQSHITKCIQYVFVYDGSNARVGETAKMAASVSKHFTIGPLAKVSGLVGAGVCTVAAVVYSAADAEVRTVAVATLNAEAVWTRHTAKVTTAASGEEKLALRYTFSGTTAADAITVQFSGMHNVQESNPSPLFDGTTADCAWSSTAHASASTRTVSLLRYGLTQNGAAVYGAEGTGTIACRVVASAAAATNCLAPANFHYVNVYKSTGTTQRGARLYFDPRTASTQDKYYNSEYDGSTNSQIISTAQTISALAPRYLVVRNSGTKLDMNHNGTTVAQVDNASSATGCDTIEIGSGEAITAGQSAHAAIGPVVLSPTRWSDADVATLQANTALYVSPPALVRWLRNTANSGAGYRGSLVLPLQSDATGYVVL